MQHLRCSLTRVQCSHYLGSTKNSITSTSIRRSRPHRHHQFRHYVAFKEEEEPLSGTRSPYPEELIHPVSKSHFYFETGYALYAKRRSRPFPPPFTSKPSTSFSDPLSTHNRSRDRRNDSFYEGEMIRGITNGDDAVLVSENMIAANDGVGAWAQKEKGHAALWSRLILHFWALEAERDNYGCPSSSDSSNNSSSSSSSSEPDPKRYLQAAYEQTKSATDEWLGTTTASGALLHSTFVSDPKPVLYVTQLGDSAILVLRPRTEAVIFKTKEQWHWFDCPRQLGTNSPDTPEQNAVMDKVEVEEDDVVLAISDGVSDNLWEHEIVEKVVEAMKEAEKRFTDEKEEEKWALGMKYVASELVKAATKIAKDPYAESPYMERAIEEGLPAEGGKLDDISVVAAICRPRKKG